MWRNISERLLKRFFKALLMILLFFPGTGISSAGRPPDTVRYDGRLPEVSGKPSEGKMVMTFMISHSLYNGEILWSETREVEVSHGEFHINLGEKVPIPIDLLNEPNLFVGMKVGDGKEIFPRFQLVQVVYVSSHSPVASQENDKHSLKEISLMPFQIDQSPQEKTMWSDAITFCEKSGKRLCRYEEWYSGYDRAETLGLRGLRGHYEWVKPWVYNWYHYEALNPLFQGKEDGCEFWMIAPTNANPFRCCRDQEGGDSSSLP